MTLMSLRVQVRVRSGADPDRLQARPTAGWRH